MYECIDAGMYARLFQIVKEVVERGVFADNFVDDISVGAYDEFCGEAFYGVDSRAPNCKKIGFSSCKRRRDVL